MGTGRQGNKKAQASPSWTQTPGLISRHIFTHWVTQQVHTPDSLYTHGHSPCFADTAGRTAEPSGTGEVVYCPQHCGSSPGLGSRRRFKEGNDAFPSPASRKSALNDSDPSIIWHSTHISFCPLSHPIPRFLTSSSYPTLPRRLSSETDVSSLIQLMRSDN